MKMTPAQKLHRQDMAQAAMSTLDILSTLADSLVSGDRHWQPACTGDILLKVGELMALMGTLEAELIEDLRKFQQ